MTKLAFDASCFKTSETLLGIETDRLTLCQYRNPWSFKTSETLLGIETTAFARRAIKISFASKPLKPF